MEKKAVLVDFSTRVRVIVELPKDANVNDDEHFDTIAEAAVKQVRDHFYSDSRYPYYDNIMDIDEDFEIPFGTLTEDI